MFKNILTQTTKKFSYFLITVILVLGLSIAVQSLLAAWTTPTASPPSGNISPPLTEGANDQVKIGSLGIASNFYVFDDVILATSSGAKVGIGTAFPAHKLHVYEKDPSGNGNAEIDIQSGGEPNDNSHWAIYHSNSDNSLRFWRNDNRLTILPDGNIGIGTTTPKAKLEVNGTIKASAPVENDDVATRGWVNAQSAGAESGNGGIITLIGDQTSAPACPDGYHSVFDGYWNCLLGFYSSGSAGAGDCFCGSMVSYTFYSSDFSARYLYSYSNQNRCRICAPSPGGQQVSAGNTVLWITQTTYNGNLGGRSGADAKCQSEIPVGLQGKCQNVHAFLSVNTNDEIRDMPNCDIDLDGIAHNWYNCQSPVYWYSLKWDKYTQMASDWQDLLDGNIAISAQDADVPGNNYYWTGSNNDGSLDSNRYCKGWLDGGGFRGDVGYKAGADVWWLSWGSYQCNNIGSLLCACQISD